MSLTNYRLHSLKEKIEAEAEEIIKARAEEKPKKKIKRQTKIQRSAKKGKIK